MAELLIKLIDYTHPDPEVDRRGAYKAGMVVAVKPDGHLWGRKESKAQWLLDNMPEQDWPEKFGIMRWFYL